MPIVMAYCPCCEVPVYRDSSARPCRVITECPNCHRKLVVESDGRYAVVRVEKLSWWERLVRKCRRDT